MNHSLNIYFRLDAKFALGPHIDGGSLERWEDEGYRNCYKKILQGRWKEHDPFDAGVRVYANSDLYNGPGQVGLLPRWFGNGSLALLLNSVACSELFRAGSLSGMALYRNAWAKMLSTSPSLAIPGRTKALCAYIRTFCLAAPTSFSGRFSRPSSPPTQWRPVKIT